MAEQLNIKRNCVFSAAGLISGVAFLPACHIPQRPHAAAAKISSALTTPPSSDSKEGARKSGRSQERNNTLFAPATQGNGLCVLKLLGLCLFAGFLRRVEEGAMMQITRATSTIYVSNLKPSFINHYLNSEKKTVFVIF